jgi:uncharacterized protein DUF5995
MPTSPIDPIIAALTAIIQKAQMDRSRIGYFAALYRRVTIAVRDQIASFQDPALLERLDVTFAQRYLDALAAWQAGRPCSSCWKVAFDFTRDDRLIVLQHLLLGINAHINLDLGVAAARTSPGPALPALHPDFLAINQLLAGEVNAVKAQLAEIFPPLRLIDQVVGRQDEDEVANFSLGTARDFAWHVAESLAPVAVPQQGPKIALLDKTIAAFGRHVARPDELLAAVYRLVRAKETQSVPEVIAILAAA